MKSWYRIGLLLTLWSGAAAAQPLTLEQAIEQALERDPRIAESRHLVDAARALLQEALGSDGLRYDVNAFVGLTEAIEGGFYQGGAFSCGATPCQPRDDGGELADGVSAWTHLEFKIIKPLYTFGKIEHYSAAAQGNVDVKRGDVRLKRNEVKLQVVKAYYGYLAARDTRYLLEDVLERVQRAENTVQRWLEEGSGDVRQSDLYALHTGKALAGRYLAQAKAVENIARDGLKLLVGLGPDQPLEVAADHIEPVETPAASLAELQQLALERRPEMEQLEAGLRARRELVAAKKADALPNIYAGLVGSMSYSPDRERIDNPFIVDPFNHAGVTPVVGIQWEWAAGSQPAKVAQAQAELEALVSKAKFARDGIPFEVAEAYYQAQGLAEAVQKLEQGSRAGRRWMLSRYVDFEGGLEEPSDVLEAFQGYVLAHTEYLSAVNDYNNQVARLKVLTGAE